MKHIIELVMAAAKCFHYSGDCGEIALLCNKNYTPIHFLPRGPASLHLATLYCLPQEIMTRWKKKNQKKERFNDRKNLKVFNLFSSLHTRETKLLHSDKFKIGGTPAMATMEVEQSEPFE